MGFKSSSKRNNNQYKVSGLIFPNEKSYRELKDIDDNVDNILSNLDNREELKAFFDKIEPIEVIETYPDAMDEAYGLFSNITNLLCFEDTDHLQFEYDFACMFYSKLEFREQ